MYRQSEEEEGRFSCSEDDQSREDSSREGRDGAHGDDRNAKVPTVSPTESSSYSAKSPPPPPPQPKGVILKSGRIRLPDKLMEYLNNQVTSSLYWQPDGQGFSIDCNTVQTELLDKHFHGSKLTSFLRSLNRWGFKRLFYHSMPSNTLSFHNPLFCKDSPRLVKEMDMVPGAPKSGAKTSTKKNCGGGASPAKKAPKQQQQHHQEEARDQCAPPVAAVVHAMAPAAALSSQAQVYPVPSASNPAVAMLPQVQQQQQLPQVAASSAVAAAVSNNNGQSSLLEKLIAEQQRAQIAAAEKANEALLLQAIVAQHQREAVQPQQNATPSSTLELIKSILSLQQPPQQQQQQSTPQQQQQYAPPPQQQQRPQIPLEAFARSLAQQTTNNNSNNNNKLQIPLQALLPLFNPSQQLEILTALQWQQNNENRNN